MGYDSERYSRTWRFGRCDNSIVGRFDDDEGCAVRVERTVVRGPGSVIGIVISSSLPGRF